MADMTELEARLTELADEPVRDIVALRKLLREAHDLGFTDGWAQGKQAGAEAEMARTGGSTEPGFWGWDPWDV